MFQSTLLSPSSGRNEWRWERGIDIGIKCMKGQSPAANRKEEKILFAVGEEHCGVSEQLLQVQKGQ